MYCPKCGAKNTDNSSFCQMCAFKLSPDGNTEPSKTINGKPVIDVTKTLGTDNAQTSAKIIITRKAKAAGGAQNHDVYLYNDYIGVLKNGGKLEIPVEVGTHMLVFKSKLKIGGKDATFSAVVNEPTEIVNLNAGFNLKGDFVITYADNAPHFANANLQSNKNAQTSANTDVPMETVSGIRCARCGSTNIFPVSETTTKGKDFRAGDALCGALLLGPLGLLCGATGKGKQTTTTTYWLCKDCGNKFKA